MKKYLLFILSAFILVFTLSSCDTSDLENEYHDFHVAYNEEEHYDLCDCGHKEHEEAHIFSDAIHVIQYESCSQEGIYEYHCIGCKYTKEVRVNKLPHEFGDWETIVEATCLNQGQEKRVCKNCGFEEFRDTNKTAHTPVAYDDLEASCTHEGYTGGTYCSVCREELTAKTIIDKKDHSFGEWITVDEPTCTSIGSAERECEACGHKEYKTLDKIPHIVPQYEDHPSTCIHKGHTGGTYCSECNTVLEERTELELAGHKYGEWITTDEPTCTKIGYAKRECEICGNTEYKELEKLAHTPVAYTDLEANCQHEGHTGGSYCSVCNIELTPYTTVDKIDHNYGQWTSVTDATCISKGQDKRVCDDCGHTEYRVTDEIPHNYVAGDSEESTCIHHGHTADLHCDYCGAIQTASEELPLKDHEYEYLKTINNPTYTSEGLDEYKCKNCEATKTVVTNRLEYTASMFKSSVSTFTDMEAKYTIVDKTNNINVTITIVNKDSIKFVKVINNITNQDNEYYLSNNVVVEKIPQGYKHNNYSVSNDLYTIYYNYLNNAFKNAPGTNELVFDSSTNSYIVTGNLVDYNYNTQNNATAALKIDSNGKAVAYSFDSANVELEVTLNYSPSSINIPTAHYHTFNYDDDCVVCGVHVDTYQAYKDNFIITYNVYSNGSIQYEFEMDNDEDPVPTFTEPTLYKSTKYNLIRITQAYTVNNVTKTFYIYKINNTVLAEYESDNLESELDTTRVGETDNAILPDGTRAHLMYMMDSNLYIKVYKEGLSESMVVLKGNVFNISGQKGNFYIWFQNESDHKMYKLNYNFNVIITEVN